MKKVSLSGSPRENVGKKDAKQVRAAGMVPAVLYGGDKQIPFSLNAIAFGKYVYTPEVYIFEIDVDGTTYKAILKDLQFHPVNDKIIHADFLQLVDDKPVKMELPVRITGSSVGVRNGGRLGVNFRRIKVNGVPDNFPDVIELDITKLRIGQALRVKDLSMEGITVLHDPEAVVVSVSRARGAVEDAEESEEGEEGAEAGEAKEASAEA